MGDLLEQQLARVERQITKGELHATLQRDILSRLEAEGLGASETAEIARDLLCLTEHRLRAHTAERKRLQAQLRRSRAA